MKEIVKYTKQILAISFVRYLIIGGINTLVSLVIFNVLLLFYKDDQLTRMIMVIPAQFTGIGVSYILNSALTFKRKLSIKGFFAFAGPLAFLQLVVGSGGMFVLSTQGVDKNVSFILITIVNVILGYVLTKTALNRFTEEA